MRTKGDGVTERLYEHDGRSRTCFARPRRSSPKKTSSAGAMNRGVSGVHAPCAQHGDGQDHVDLPEKTSRGMSGNTL